MASAIFVIFIFMFFRMVESVTVNVFILAGQSNMVGEGGVANGALHGYDEWDEVVPSECEPNAFILRLNAGSKWEEAHEPLHSLYGSTANFGIGPGMPFANALRQMDPAIGLIGLVPCAVAGSNITAWGRNSSYYSNMLKNTRAALAQGGVLRALLWYQGESDTRDADSAGAYGARVMELFENVREDLAAPSLPIIQVALATGFNFKEIVRQAQLQLKLANLKCVDADGLQVEPPSCAHDFDQRKCIHLSTPAQVQLGTMLAEAFLQF